MDGVFDGSSHQIITPQTLNSILKIIFLCFSNYWSLL
jgi:hypothetical protein